MRIETIRLRNFRPYLSAHEYDLSTPKGSNLIIIFGENMTGKTALFTAIRWCLYGRAYDRQEQRIPVFHAAGGEQLLNTVAASSGDYSLEVSIDFEHLGRRFELRRVAAAEGQPESDEDFESDVFLKIDDDRIADDQIEVQIGGVLHEDVARFSLFDGEMLNDYEKLLKDLHAEGRTIREAIEKTLGLPALTRGAGCLGELASESEKELNRHLKKQQKHQAAVQSRDSLDNELGSKRRELASLQAKAAQVAGELEQARRDLGEQQEFNRLSSQASAVESEIDSAKRKREQHLVAIRSELEASWWVGMAGAIKSKVRDVDESITEESRRLEGALYAALASNSIAKGKCEICGQDLSAHATTHLRERAALGEGKRNAAADQGLVSRLHEQRKFLSNLRVDRASERVLAATREIISLDSEINTKEERWRSLKAELATHTKGDAEAKGRRYAQLEVRAREIDDLQERVLKRIGELEQEIDTQQKIINKFVGAGDVTKRKAELARLSEKAFRRAIDSFRDAARERVGAEANAIFRQLTTEERYQGLAINENYGLVIRDSQGNPLPGASAGAEHIVSLSLIGGLNRTAVSGEAPLVMDTNFGRLDRSHRKNVLKWVESLDQQVILLVHSGELDAEDLRSFDVRCGRRFRIRRISEWESELEVDSV